MNILVDVLHDTRYQEGLFYVLAPIPISISMLYIVLRWRRVVYVACASGDGT